MTKATVGICAHNEEETIGDLIDSILSENVPIEQIIVVVSGDDDTKDILEAKQKDNSIIELFYEKERRGQSAAQNTILSKAKYEALFLIDGDGVIEKLSLERMWSKYNGNQIIYGREIPQTKNNFSGDLIDQFWEIHHKLSLKQPKYTTQIALQPTELVDYIPPEIVVDDEYIGIIARRKGYEINYLPQAVKHHNIKGDISSFVKHRRKNWAGMLQIKANEKENLQKDSSKINVYLSSLFTSGFRKKFLLLLIGLIELYSFLWGFKRLILGNMPYIWDR